MRGRQDLVENNKTAYRLKTVNEVVTQYLALYKTMQMPRLMAGLHDYNKILGSAEAHQNQPFLRALSVIEAYHKKILELSLILEQPKNQQKIKANKFITFEMEPSEFATHFDLTAVPTLCAQFRQHLIKLSNAVKKIHEKRECELYARYPYRHGLSPYVVVTFIGMMTIFSLTIKSLHQEDSAYLSKAMFFLLIGVNLVMTLMLDNFFERKQFAKDITKLEKLTKVINAVINENNTAVGANSGGFINLTLRDKRVSVGLTEFSIYRNIQRSGQDKLIKPVVRARATYCTSQNVKRLLESGNEQPAKASLRSSK